MPRNVVVLFDNTEGRELIRAVCKKRRIGFPEFQELVQAEVGQTGKQRKRGLYDVFDDILDRLDEE